MLWNISEKGVIRSGPDAATPLVIETPRTRQLPHEVDHGILTIISRPFDFRTNSNLAVATIVVYHFSYDMSQPLKDQ